MAAWRGCHSVEGKSCHCLVWYALLLPLFRGDVSIVFLVADSRRIVVVRMLVRVAGSWLVTIRRLVRNRGVCKRLHAVKYQLMVALPVGVAYQCHFVVAGSYSAKCQT